MYKIKYNSKVDELLLPWLYTKIYFFKRLSKNSDKDSELKGFHSIDLSRFWLRLKHVQREIFKFELVDQYHRVSSSLFRKSWLGR